MPTPIEIDDEEVNVLEEQRENHQPYKDDNVEIKSVEDDNAIVNINSTRNDITRQTIDTEKAKDLINSIDVNSNVRMHNLSPQPLHIDRLNNMSPINRNETSQSPRLCVTSQSPRNFTSMSPRLRSLSPRSNVPGLNKD
jgi:hypothetical protein